jgi:hypothetical protein
MILLLGNLTTETVIAQVGCPGKNISQFTTSSPIGLLQSAITNPSTGRIIEPFFLNIIMYFFRYLPDYT